MRLIVTGATGFLGGRLVEILLQQGHEVIASGRNPVEGVRLTKLGAYFIASDLAELERNLMDCGVVDAMVHCAAFSSPWGRFSDHYKANVLGTQQVISLCKSLSISKLVHISTPSMYFDYRDRQGILEGVRLPKPVNHYAHTKQLAEQLILDSGLAAIILRPRGIFGPGDTALMPRLLRAKVLGSLPMFHRNQIKVDLTYVDNVVHAISLALLADNVIDPQIYNVTNDEPVFLQDFVAKLFLEMGESIQFRYIPYQFADNIARFLELLYRGLLPNSEPPMTRYTVGLFRFDQTLSVEKIKADLGYSPIVTMESGLKRFASWWQAGRSN